jgi:hypothetical protein
MDQMCCRARLRVAAVLSPRRSGLPGPMIVLAAMIRKTAGGCLTGLSIYEQKKH